MGSAIARSIELSLPITIEHTAFQLASRSMGAYMMNNDEDCSTYVSQVLSAESTTDFCDQYSFRNLT